jgi:RecJ-like exonuclease
MSDEPRKGDGEAPGRPDLAPGDEVPADLESAADNICPECEGSGRLEGERCPHCEGRGRVVEAIGGG